jgi:cytoskeletal protein CcmA (bactofilin family)
VFFTKTELDSAYELAFEHFVSSSHLSSPADRNIPRSFELWRQGFEPSAEPRSAPLTVAARASSQIIFDGELVVNGYIAGELCSPDGELLVEPTGEIDGDIAVSVVTVHGQIRGDIRASRRVELGSRARVIGDIETVELLIQQGAVFKGQCTSPKAPSTSEDSSAAVEPGEDSKSLAAANQAR